MMRCRTERRSNEAERMHEDKNPSGVSELNVTQLLAERVEEIERRLYIFRVSRPGSEFLDKS